MPASEKSKTKQSSKSKSKGKDAKSDKKDKKSESKDKKSDKKDKKDKKSEKGDKSVKSDKKSSKSKSDSPTKSDKGKKDKASKSSKGKKEADETTSKVDAGELKSQAEEAVPKPEGAPEVDPNAPPAESPVDPALLPKGGDMGGMATMGAMPQLQGGLMGPPGEFDRKRYCILHKKPLIYFCVSCEELICYDCTTMGPHNTQLHRISSIEDAFKDRFDSINRSIHQSLVPKRA